MSLLNRQSFGGPGWRIDRYYNGSREEADVLAVEQCVHLPLGRTHNLILSADSLLSFRYTLRNCHRKLLCPLCLQYVLKIISSRHEWDIDATYAVLANARSKFDWDDSRLYLSTFSMVRISLIGSRSILTFTCRAQEQLGLY